MKAVLLIIGSLSTCFFNLPTPPGELLVEVVVEGVAPRPQAAPIAALGEIRERISGTTFNVIDGKYISLGEGPVLAPLDTRGKNLISMEELKTGLFKARLKVQVPSDLIAFQEKLGTRMVRGEGELAAAGNLVLAREQARRDALENGILETVRERYPKGSIPPFLRGRVIFLGTVREGFEAGSYTLLTRLKVELIEP